MNERENGRPSPVTVISACPTRSLGKGGALETWRALSQSGWAWTSTALGGHQAAGLFMAAMGHRVTDAGWRLPGGPGSSCPCLVLPRFAFSSELTAGYRNQSGDLGVFPAACERELRAVAWLLCFLYQAWGRLTLRITMKEDCVSDPQPGPALGTGIASSQPDNPARGRRCCPVGQGRRLTLRTPTFRAAGDGT